MKRARMYLYIFSSLLLNISAMAQDIPATEKVQDIIFIQQMLSTENFIDPLQQYFSSNTFIGNNAWIMQKGNHNDARINQQGNYNLSGIVQTGDYNEADLDLFGNRNMALIEQYGSFNSAEKTITGDDNSFYLMQDGNGLIFNIEASLPPGTTIIQEGNGMKLEIK